jgi:hypothetical protein
LSGAAAAAEGQDALNALETDCNSSGSDRARSRSAEITKVAKKVVYYLKTRRSPKRLARRLAYLASSFFLTAASSYHEVLAVTQLGGVDADCAEADAARPDEGLCHAAPRLSPHPTSPTEIFLCRD